MRVRALVVVTFSATSLVAGAAHAQQAPPPLAEVARQAEAAKPFVKKAAKTYTNASLGAAQADDDMPVATAQPATGFESKSLGKAVTADEMLVRSEQKIQQDDVAQQSEPAWRGRAASLRKQIDDLQSRLSVLSVSNPLTEANPLLKKGQQQDLANVRQAIGGLQKKWAVLEASASAAKIPGEWLDPRPKQN